MNADPNEDVPFLPRGIMKKYEKNVKKFSNVEKSISVSVNIDH